MGKGDNKRRRARRKAEQRRTAEIAGQHAAQGGNGTHAAAQAVSGGKEAERPTAQRLARGNWNIPKGMGKHERPAIDTSADIIGQLHDAGKITGGQEQAARHWQSVRARYVAELPDVATFKSCIAGSVPGYDDGDGDEQAIFEYRQIERRLSRAQRVEMLHVCEDGYKPRNLDILRAALDVVGGR
jgi:hypothetical protein